MQAAGICLRVSIPNAIDDEGATGNNVAVVIHFHRLINWIFCWIHGKSHWGGCYGRIRNGGGKNITPGIDAAMRWIFLRYCVWRPDELGKANWFPRKRIKLRIWMCMILGQASRSISWFDEIDESNACPYCVMLWLMCTANSITLSRSLQWGALPGNGNDSSTCHLVVKLFEQGRALDVQ